MRGCLSPLSSTLTTPGSGRDRQKSILPAEPHFPEVKCAATGAKKTIHHFLALWLGTSGRKCGIQTATVCVQTFLCFVVAVACR